MYTMVKTLLPITFPINGWMNQNISYMNPILDMFVFTITLRELRELKGRYQELIVKPLEAKESIIKIL